jgi:hypothetical protein
MTNEADNIILPFFIFASSDFTIQVLRMDRYVPYPRLHHVIFFELYLLGYQSGAKLMHMYQEFQEEQC